MVRGSRMRLGAKEATVIRMVAFHGARRWMALCVLLVGAGGASAAQLATAREQPSAWAVTELGAGLDGEHVTVNNRGQVLALGGDLGSSPALWENGKLTVIGRLGGQESQALALNERGQVVGWSDTKRRGPAGGHAFAHHAFLWQSGRVRDLGTLGGAESEAFGLNDRGQVVGWANTSSGARHAFLWQSGHMRDLGTLGGSNSVATLINEHGQVAGSSTTGSRSSWRRPFLWQNGRMRDLGAVYGGLPDMKAVDINERGDVIGRLIWSGEGTHSPGRAWLWHAGRTRGLPTCGVDAIPFAMNDRGEVVGASLHFDDGFQDPVLWRNGSMTVLIGSCKDEDSLGGANDISESGQIVGYYMLLTANAETRAFLWQAGRRTDLPALEGATDSVAFAINDRNQIVGTSGGSPVVWTRR